MVDSTPSQDRTSPEEKSEATVVVCLTDLDPAKREERARRLLDLHQGRVESGFLRVVAPPANIYPPEEKDKKKRPPRWRTKLTLDFAFLFSYCHGTSEYFLNMVSLPRNYSIYCILYKLL